MYLTQEELESLPDEVQAGKLAVKDALGKLSALVLESPGRYIVSQHDDDLVSEVIVELLQKGFSLFDNYDRKFGSFSGYFASYVRFLSKSVRRASSKETFSGIACWLSHQETYSRDEAKYSENEYPARITTFRPYLPPQSALAPYRIHATAHTAEDKSCEYRAADSSHLPDFFQTKQPVNKRIALVLALKSSYYLTDEHIDAVSGFCGIPKDELHTAISALKSGLRPKIEKFIKIQDKRAHSYFLHCKYRLRLQYLKEQEVRTERRLHELYEMHTRNWRRTNSLLQEHSYAVCPSNKKLAELLRICERQIGYYIKRADKLRDLRKIGLEEGMNER